MLYGIVRAPVANREPSDFVQQLYVAVAGQLSPRATLRLSVTRDRRL
jgi:hypothetical protein